MKDEQGAKVVFGDFWGFFLPAPNKCISISLHFFAREGKKGIKSTKTTFAIFEIQQKQVHLVHLILHLFDNRHLG